MTFLNSIPTAPLLFSRSYSRHTFKGRETFPEIVDRCINGLTELGKLTPEESAQLRQQMESGVVFPSGRWLWCGGTEWASKPENYYGTYNCSSTELDSVEAFGCLMNLAMQGTGTGANLEPRNIEKLPIVCNQLKVEVTSEVGSIYGVIASPDKTQVFNSITGKFTILVGDSRQGWVDSYVKLIQIATDPLISSIANIKINLSLVRPAGEKLKGFGGTANPIKLPELYTKIADILNGAIGRQLNSIECCLLIDEAALVIVAGNIRRSAGIRQFCNNDEISKGAKAGLWKEDEQGNWYMPNPERDSLRMSNHTTVYHKKPTLEQCIDSVRSQYYSGEGAIQWAGEAIARSNADIVKGCDYLDFLADYNSSIEEGREFLDGCMESENKEELNHRMNRYGLNPCLASGTMIITRNHGIVPIEQLVGLVSIVWDGERWIETEFVLTGNSKPIYAVTLSNKSEIYATNNHDFVLSNGSKVQLKDLKVGSALKTHSIASVTNSSIGMTSRGNITVTKISSEPVDTGDVYCCNVPTTHNFALGCGAMTGNCGEIIGSDFLCNLSDVHLNQIDPLDLSSQILAFETAAIEVCALLHHKFDIERYRISRELDPIVGVSFTGLFDFFVNLFGADWLKWWEAGRPDTFSIANSTHSLEVFDLSIKLELQPRDFVTEYFDYALFFTAIEQKYLQLWQETVTGKVAEYCTRHGLKVPNRCTTVQPSGSKSLLTGASPGWHPPKAQQFIRRITFAKNDPIALASIDYGYTVIPSQSDKDENGNLLNDPFDPRCTEWLVEIPCQVAWAGLPGVPEIDISQFSALAQMSFYMQVQQFYTRHNTSATIELREHEIEPLANRIFEAIRDDEGYMSAALLSRFDDWKAFPRLPFEPIDRATYLELVAGVEQRRVSDDFDKLLAKYDVDGVGDDGSTSGGCDSDKCLYSPPVR